MTYYIVVIYNNYYIKKKIEIKFCCIYQYIRINHPTQESTKCDPWSKTVSTTDRPE